MKRKSLSAQAVRRIDLTKLSVDQLVDRFADIGVAQDDALWARKYAKFNRLYKLMDDVDHELRARGIETRRALARLFEHRDTQVRLQAAKWIFAVEPVRARKVIEDRGYQQVVVLSAGRRCGNVPGESR